MKNGGNFLREELTAFAWLMKGMKPEKDETDFSLDFQHWPHFNIAIGLIIRVDVTANILSSK